MEGHIVTTLFGIITEFYKERGCKPDSITLTFDQYIELLKWSKSHEEPDWYLRPVTQFEGIDILLEVKDGTKI